MATLGGLIKDYRIQKRLSQLDIASEIGWSDATRLSKIEQGRTSKPTRKVLEKISQALGLSETEKNELLLFGSYLPTKEETKRAINEVKEKLDSWQYPATMTDFTWRMVAFNKPAAKTFYVNPNIDLFKVDFNFLELPFLPKSVFPVEILKGEDEETLQPFPIFQVAQFKLEEHIRTEETWYRKLIAKLMKKENFRHYWTTVTPNSYKKKLLDYEYKVVKGNWLGKKQVLKFHLLSSKLISDSRFQTILYFPADKETESFYVKKLYLKVKV